jgi:hypothetical protein
VGKEVQEAEKVGGMVVRGVFRVVAAIIGAIGALILIIVNSIISAKHAILGSSVPQSHGVVGLLAFVVGALGVIATLINPRVGAALMAVAGLGFIYVAGWGAVFATPFLVLAAVVAFLDRPKSS